MRDKQLSRRAKSKSRDLLISSFDNATCSPAENNPAGSEIEEPVWECGRALLDSYLVESLLGRGGMGSVYLVRRKQDSESFAVKTLLPSLTRNTEKQRYFLRELRTWIDLPQHPNLVMCRFFRTIEDQLAIFLEYVDGGSLKNWIEEQRLLKNEQILDIAIQLAWGLQTAHDQGVIHQDIKPANILIGHDGIPKITDFGLSRARLASGLDTQHTAGVSTILVSAEGLTPAYCSPEQAMGKKLSRKTDIWSYGVTILEMYYGKVKWKYGGLAPFALESLIEEGPVAPYPAIPECVADILWKCFETSPKSRWSEMGDIADAMIEAFNTVAGHPYSRCKPEPEIQKPAVTELERSGSFATKWSDPAEWLKRALNADGRDENELIELMGKRSGSRKALAIADLEILSEASQIYSLLSEKNTFHHRDYAMLLSEKAILHGAIDDLPGAIGCYERSIAIFRQLINRDSKVQDRILLAKILSDKSLICERMSDWETSLALSQESIDIIQIIRNTDPEVDVRGEIAQLLLRQAMIMVRLGRTQSAIEVFDRSIKEYQNMFEGSADERSEADLARAYGCKAVALNRLARKREAIDLLESAILINEKLVASHLFEDLYPDLGNMYMNKAIMLWDLHDFKGSIDYYDRAIAIREKLVYESGRQDISKDLAIVYMNKALVLCSIGKPRMALSLLNNAAIILERLVFFEGRNDLQLTLARSYCNHFVALDQSNKKLKSTELLDRAIEILESMVVQEKRWELKNELASVYSNKAGFLIKKLRYEEALQFLDRAIELRERLIYEMGQSELLEKIIVLYNNKAIALKMTGKRGEAGQFFKKTLSIFDRLIKENGREDLIDDWIDSQKDYILTLPADKQQQAAQQLYDIAGEILKSPALKHPLNHKNTLEQILQIADFEDGLD